MLLELVHQVQEGTNQAEVAKGENKFPRPGLTGSLMPIEQVPISSPLDQMASPISDCLNALMTKNCLVRDN